MDYQATEMYTVKFLLVVILRISKRVVQEFVSVVKPDGKPEYVHTIKRKWSSIGRTVAAILENYQQADGTVSSSRSISAIYGWKNSY